MYKIKPITQKEIWETFVLAQPHSLFVQSPQYGTFYEHMGEQSWLWGIFLDDKLVGGSLVVSIHAKRGSFLYLPYGPFLPEEGSGEALTALVEALVLFGKKEKYLCIKASPFIDENSESLALFARVGFRSAPLHILAETTWILDISKDEDTLLSEMNKNHRNLIRRCEREGVIVKQDADVASLEDLDTLLDTTAKRHNFVRFSARYIKEEFLAFSERGQAEILRGYLPTGELDAVSMSIYYGNMAVYRHSASVGLNKHLPTSYLIQWRTIQEAKKRGTRWYNFWGIAPNNASPSHPFFGITHFKKGFGGFQKDLVHCQDYPLSWKYAIPWCIDLARKKYRRF